MSAKIDDQFAAHLRAALQAHVMTTPARDRRTRQRTALGAGIGVLILGGGVAYARTDIEDGHGLGSAERLATEVDHVQRRRDPDGSRRPLLAVHPATAGNLHGRWATMLLWLTRCAPNCPRTTPCG
jgi:hypothetical protein